MKYFILIIFLLSDISFAKAQRISKDTELGNAIIHSLQNKDIKAYFNLLISKEEYFNEISPNLSKDTIHKIPEFMIHEGDKFYKEDGIEKLNFLIFHQIIDQGTKLGITNWEKIKFSKFSNYDLSNNKTNKIIVGDMYFTFLDTIFKIYGVAFNKLKNGIKLLYCMGLLKVDFLER